MDGVIHRKAVVGPDSRIEISAPELRPGQRVAVTIEPEPSVDPFSGAGGESYMIELIEESPGQQLFKTADEVDEYLKQERDSWDR